MARRAAESRELTTTVEVLQALGGIPRVAELTEQDDVRNVDNWQRSETFPARYFLVMWLDLVSRGYSASPRLWGQRNLPRSKEAMLRDFSQKWAAAA